MRNTTAGIQAEIAKGVFRPHTALTNMALAYYQNASNYFAKALFPTCPVGLSSDNYYIFSREDLLRDNWQRKPAYGKVDPTVVGESTDNYVCKVDQMIMGIDQIRQTDLSRRQGPSIIQPKQQRTRTIAEQANIHQDRLFAVLPPYLTLSRMPGCTFRALNTLIPRPRRFGMRPVCWFMSVFSLSINAIGSEFALLN